MCTAASCRTPPMSTKACPVVLLPVPVSQAVHQVLASLVASAPPDWRLVVDDATPTPLPTSSSGAATAAAVAIVFHFEDSSSQAVPFTRGVAFYRLDQVGGCRVHVESMEARHVLECSRAHECCALKTLRAAATQLTGMVASLPAAILAGGAHSPHHRGIGASCQDAAGGAAGGWGRGAAAAGAAEQPARQPGARRSCGRHSHTSGGVCAGPAVAAGVLCCSVTPAAGQQQLWRPTCWPGSCQQGWHQRRHHRHAWKRHAGCHAASCNQQQGRWRWKQRRQRPRQHCWACWRLDQGGIRCGQLQPRLRPAAGKQGRDGCVTACRCELSLLLHCMRQLVLTSCWC